MATRVVNKHAEPFEVYIGRGSIWGNPYSHRRGTKAEFAVGSRAEAVEAYREYLWRSPELLGRLDDL